MVVRVEEQFTKMEKKNRGKKRKLGYGARGNQNDTAVNKNKNKGQSKGFAVEGQVPVMDGMSQPEVLMIRKLAGNDPLVRKKTIKKLRKWLGGLAQHSSDTLECRLKIEPNLVRVWKALFYCMWMADKPLPQEQLAEQISDLVNIFASKPNAMLIFVEWFFRTMAREWSWIDRLRLDKFMMLIRRFVRKTLAALANNKWKAESVDALLKIIRIHIFNHHPAPPKIKKGGASPTPQQPYVHCPVGFQIHIIDIFLEEVAKVDGAGISSPKVIKLLGPFIHELATNDDDRVLAEIKERVFHHLMKQSDVGMDYEEAMAYGGYEMSDDDEDELDDEEEEEEGEDQEEEEDVLSGEEENDNVTDEEEDEVDENDEEEKAVEEDEDEVYEMDDGPLDPRAGAVDVVLPQLELDYAVLAEKLTEAGGEKTVKKKNRGLLYSLASQFREIVQGKYPLALPEEEPNKPAIPKKEVKKATARLVALDSTSGLPKKRKTKKQRRKEAKLQAQAMQNSQDSIGSEDGSAYLNDDDLMDHVSDNYVSYVHEQMEGPQEEEEVEDDEDEEFEDDEDEEAEDNEDEEAEENNHEEVEDSEDDDAEDTPPKPKKKKKSLQPEEQGEKKKKKYKTIIEVEADELDDDLEGIPTLTLATTPEATAKDEVIHIRQPKSSAKRMKTRPTEDLFRLAAENALKNKTMSPLPSSSLGLKGKSPKLSPNSSTPKTPMNRKSLGVSSNSSGPSSSAKKRVSFVLARNKQHDATDYIPSIQKSPAIPFDASKTPTSGLLKKSSLGKAARASGKISLTSPRKKALDFFF